MTPDWTDFDPHAPAPKPAEQRTNQELFDEWSAVDAAGGSPVSHRHRMAYVRRFINAMGTVPIATASSHLLWQWVAKRASRCINFREETPSLPTRCIQALDLATCNTECPNYERLAPQSFDQEMAALVAFGDFLVAREYVDHNLFLDIRRYHRKLNRKRTTRKQPQRTPTPEEMRILVNEVPYLHHSMAFFLPAKFGLRYSELSRLRVDPGHLDLEEGWLNIPRFPGKRKGQDRFPIDDESRLMLDAYLPWRHERVDAAVERGSRVDHDFLLVTMYGDPLDPHDERYLNRRIYRHYAEHFGMQKPTHNRRERIQPHGGRRFYSTAIKRNGADPFWYAVLRGDLGGNTEHPYIVRDDESVKEQYMRLAPRIGIYRGDVLKVRS